MTDDDEARGVSHDAIVDGRTNERTNERTSERTDGRTRMIELARSLRARICFRGRRAALNRCTLRGDPVLEIGIDVIRYAPNRYPEGKSKTEREEGREREEKRERDRQMGNIFRIPWSCIVCTVRLASAAFTCDARRRYCPIAFHS